MFVRTLVTAAGPRAMSSSGHPITPARNRYRTKRHTAWTPVTLRERAGGAGGPQGKTKTKPPGTSGSLAFPCERADHLEVSCSERYPRPGPPSNGSGKFTFHRMWTSLWKRCAPIVDVLWTEVVIGSQSGWRYVETCSTVVSSNLSGYICRLSSADSVFTAYAPCSVSATYVPAGFGRFARVAAYPDR